MSDSQTPPNPPNLTKPDQGTHRRKAATAIVAAIAVTAGAVFGPHQGSGFPYEVNGCSIYGNGTPTNAKGKENALKNRYTLPDDSDIDPAVSLEALLGLKKGPKEEMARMFDETKAAKIAGYVLDVVPGSEESCNCKATAPQYKDAHVYLGKTPDAKKENAIVVEITPRIRILRAKDGIDWSTTEIKKLKGKYVLVTGWLFFDGEHWTNSADNPDAKGKIWRKTCWELHPVTDLQEIAP